MEKKDVKAHFRNSHQSVLISTRWLITIFICLLIIFVQLTVKAYFRKNHQSVLMSTRWLITIFFCLLIIFVQLNVSLFHRPRGVLFYCET